MKLFNKCVFDRCLLHNFFHQNILNISSVLTSLQHWRTVPIFTQLWYISLHHKSHKHTQIESEEEGDMLQQAATWRGICLLLPVLYKINTPLTYWHSNTHSFLTWALPWYMCVSVCVCGKKKERKSTSSVALGKYHSETDRCLSLSDSYLHLTMCLAAWASGLVHTHRNTHTNPLKHSVCVYFCVQYKFEFSSV